MALAVGDLDSSTRFYTEGLGFEPGPSFESGDETAGVSEVEPPARITLVFLADPDGTRIELLQRSTAP